LATGLWKNLDEIRAMRIPDQEYLPDMDDADRQTRLRGWHKAVGRSLDWVEHDN
jgi:glycerol kinase